MTTDLAEKETVTEQPTLAIAPVPATLFGAADGPEVIRLATRHARALTDVLKNQHLTLRIGPKDYIRVEGWTLLGSMVGVFAVEDYTRPIPEDWIDRGLDMPMGFEARVEARTLEGRTVGAANARCMRAEKRWSTADDYAIASMAQTRATAKALRQPLGFIVVLAGYSGTPAEEIPEGGEDWTDRPAPPAQAKARRKPNPTVPEDESDDAPATRALWKIADGVFGGRANVIAYYRDDKGVTGTVQLKSITNADLRGLIELARETSGGDAVEEAAPPE